MQDSELDTIHAMSDSTQLKNPQRRWYQFSLQTLLIVMVLATVTFGGWIQSMRLRTQENRARVASIDKAVAAIEASGGWLVRGYKKRSPQTWLQELFNDPGGADEPMDVYDGIVVKLVTDLDDTTVEHLSRLTDFKGLWLTGSQVTDTSLAHLKRLDNLNNLVLERTKVTDAGLEQLMELTRLQYLEFEGPDFTDAGLEHLIGLTNLHTLQLLGTNVTNERVKKLRQALPNCKIYHEPLFMPY